MFLLFNQIINNNALGRFGRPLGHQSERCNSPRTFSDAFLAPLRFRRGPTHHFFFVEDRDKIKKNDVQEGVLKNMISRWVSAATMGGLAMQKQTSRMIHVTKYEVSVFHENASKMKCERGLQMTFNSSFGRSGVRFYSFWEVC